MTFSDAKLSVAMLMNAPWPTGSTCTPRIMRTTHRPMGFSVSVVLSTVDGDAERHVLLEPATFNRIQVLMAHAAAMVIDRCVELSCVPSRAAREAEAGTSPAWMVDACEGGVERRPAWLRESDQKVYDLKGVNEGAKRLAWRLMKAVEMDDIPVPFVKDMYDGSLFLQWEQESRILAIRIYTGHAFEIFTAGPDDSNRPLLTHDLASANSRKRAVDDVRRAVRWVLCRVPFTTEDVMELCVVRRKGAAA